MKLIYISRGDPRDRRLWSGTARRILLSLEEAGHQVDVQIIPHHPIELYAKLKWRWYHYLRRQNFHFDTDPLLNRFAARALRRAVQGKNFDAVVAWHPLHGVLLETEKPFVYWYDASFQRSIPTYFSTICAESRRNGIALEALAVKRCAAAVYPTDWARNTMLEDYHADPAKVHVVPFGANFESEPTIDQVREGIRTRLQRRSSNGEVRLLYVGLDWKRKRGDTAVAVAREANRLGINCKLVIVGCRPELAPQDLQFVEIVGLLNKNNPLERARLDALYATSDFFILTSYGESYGIVYCEAMAWGLPLLATDTGGVATLVRNGVNGRLASWQADPPTELAAYLAELSKDPAAYEQISHNSRHLYDTVFNWRVAGRRFSQILESVV